MSEVWLPVVGFEGSYEVSSLGRVRSVDREVLRRDGVTNHYKGKLLKPAPGGSGGYPCVKLGRAAWRYVHTLVLEAFVGPKPEGCQCLHGNDVSDDNRPSNLRWGTSLENIHEAYRNGGRAGGERHGRAKLTEIQARHVKYGTDPVPSLARRFRVHPSTIRSIRTGKNWTFL